jgi:biotin carboxylase
MIENNNKPVAIVLGGTNPHKKLLEKLKNRGFFAVLIDYLPNPPAKLTADLHVQESTLDKDKVLEIAQKLNAQLVIATCVDQANVTACYVAEKLNLPHPYSYEVASEISDKVKMKLRMKKANIPTAAYIQTSSVEGLNVDSLNFPLVVKPSDSNGSKGVRRVDNNQELNDYLQEALCISRNGMAVVEEFIEGDEIGVDCFIVNGKAHIVTMHKKRKPSIKDGTVIYSIGSISPPNISVAAKNLIVEIADKIAAEFELQNTPLLMQLIVSGDKVNVVEFAPRIGGGLNFRKIKLFADFDILEASIDSYYNQAVEIPKNNIDFLYSENHIYVEAGVFGGIEGIDELVNENTILEFYQNKTQGASIFSGNASKDRVGSFIVRARDINEVKSKIRRVFDTIKIYDIDGQPMKYSYDYIDLLLD